MPLDLATLPSTSTYYHDTAYELVCSTKQASLSNAQILPVASEISHLLKYIFNNQPAPAELFNSISDPVFKCFLAHFPDPTVWFKHSFPYLKDQTIKSTVTPVGIAFELEGEAYSKFVWQEGIRTNNNDPVSLGVTLRLSKMPSHMHNLFVVVNRGERYEMPDRSCEQQIQDTMQHEFLHSIFNSMGFCQANFIDNIELRKRAADLDLNDLSGFKKLAKELTEGMIELSRSEIVSYYATGYYNVEDQHLNANFWQTDLHTIESVLAEKNCPAEQSAKIMQIFKSAENLYRQHTALNKTIADYLLNVTPALDKAQLAEKLLSFSSLSIMPDNLSFLDKPAEETRTAA